MAEVVFLLLNICITEGLFPAVPWLSPVCRTRLGAQQVPLCPWHSLWQERWPAVSVHQTCPQLWERACKSFLSLPCRRAVFLLGEGRVESHGLPGCSLVPEPNPFVRAPQQETCGTLYTCQTFYSYSIRDL